MGSSESKTPYPTPPQVGVYFQNSLVSNVKTPHPTPPQVGIYFQNALVPKVNHAPQLRLKWVFTFRTPLFRGHLPSIKN